MPYRAPSAQRLRYVRYCLDVLTTPTRCATSWDLMDGSDCARLCGVCRETVFDVSAMDDRDADEFLREHMVEPPRLALHRRPDGRLLRAECGPGARQRVARRIVTGLVALVAAAIAVAALR
ncbi:MAG: hypothetical protein WDN08_04660 [Rhizomicrobium sp.]